MTAFEQFNVIPPNTISPALAPERCTLNHDDFSAEAFQVLNGVADYVATELPQRLDEFLGRWHPSGFMIFQLGTHPELGMLRLHVWPEAQRQVGEKGDTIHDHAWHIASVALRGTYRDTIFDASPQDATTERERKERGLLAKFEAQYAPGAPQALIDSGERVLAEPVAHREIPEGETHTIEPDVFHQPTIAYENSAVTLVLSSFRVHNGGPFVLFDGPPNTIQEDRQYVTDDDLEITRGLLG